MDKASLEIENFDILDGDVLMELDDFSKLLWVWINEDVLSVLPERPSVGSGSLQTDPVAEYKYIFFIHYFNLLMVHVLGHGLRKYRSFARKHLSDKNMRDFLTKKQSIQDILAKNAKIITVLNAIIRNFISKLMENGISTQRLDSSLDMHYLNAVSVVVPNIRKNAALRSHIIPLVIEDASLVGRLKRLFSK